MLEDPTVDEGRPREASTGGRDRTAMFGGVPGFSFVALFIILYAIFSFASPDVFFTSGTTRTILQTSAVAMLLSTGLVFVLIVKDFDLSITANAALAGSAAVVMMTKYEQPTWVAVAVALAVGVVAGALNGVIVAYFKANALIATLATTSVFIGLQEWITSNNTISLGINESYLDLAAREWAGLPAQVVVIVVLTAVLWLILTRTVFGRQTYATGANQAASYLAGIRIQRVRFAAFVILGFYAGAAGVCLTALSGSTPQSGSATAYLLPAYAAAFLGAITLGRGRFTAWSALLGVVFVNTLQTGLIVVQAPVFLTNLLTGMVLLGAVLLSRVRAGGLTAV